MARALGAAIALVLLVPAVSLAQDEDESVWPTAYEVRRELQSIGYDCGSRPVFPAWECGREAMLTAAMSGGRGSAITLHEGSFGLTLLAFVAESEASLGWPESTLSSLTALMEVLSMLGTDVDSRSAIMWHLGTADEAGCWWRPIPGGFVEVERTKLFGNWSVTVRPETMASTMCADPHTLLAPIETSLLENLSTVRCEALERIIDGQTSRVLPEASDEYAERCLE